MFVIEKVTGESFKLIFQAATQGFFGFFPLDAAEAGDVVGAFLFPPMQGGLDYAEFLGDVAEAFAGSAEFYEFIFSFVVVHMFSAE